jgi:hypothetical protein
VLSPIRAAGLPPINTVPDPAAMVSGGPVQTHMSPTVAAGNPPISTVGAPGGNTGPPTCGTGPGFTIGQVCISVILAAKDIFLFTIWLFTIYYLVIYYLPFERCIASKHLNCKSSNRQF